MRIPAFGAKGRSLDGAPARLLDARRGVWVRLPLSGQTRFDRLLRGSDAAGLLGMWLFMFAVAAGWFSLEDAFARARWHAAPDWIHRLLPVAVGLAAGSAGALRLRRARRFLRERGAPVDGPVRPDAPKRAAAADWTMLAIACLVFAGVSWRLALDGHPFESAGLALAAAAATALALHVRRVNERLRALAAAFDAEHPDCGQSAGC